MCSRLVTLCRHVEYTLLNTSDILSSPLNNKSSTPDRSKLGDGVLHNFLCLSDPLILL